MEFFVNLFLWCASSFSPALFRIRPWILSRLYYGLFFPLKYRQIVTTHRLMADLLLIKLILIIKSIFLRKNILYVKISNVMLVFKRPMPLISKYSKTLPRPEFKRPSHRIRFAWTWYGWMGQAGPCEDGLQRLADIFFNGGLQEFTLAAPRFPLSSL